jgi:dTDP-glucose 4,6-dehydratase
MPSSPYSASKAAAENFIFGYHKTFGLDYLIVRSCNNYGIRQYPEKLIPFFISRIFQGMDLPLYGNGQNVREWINVRDFASACVQLVKLGARNDVYNISSGDFKSNEQIALLLCEMLDYPIIKIAYVADRPGHDFRYAINSSKVRKFTSWAPEIEFTTGLIETIDWYRK